MEQGYDKAIRFTAPPKKTNFGKGFIRLRVGLKGILGITVILLILQLTVMNSLAASFTDNDDGTVTDSDTGLMWQQGDDGSTRTWQDALSHCEGLSLAGYSDWGLPDVKKLESIADHTVIDPAIDTTFFPDAASNGYWSATTAGAVNAFYVKFSDGLLWSGDKTFEAYVRCVR